jgi:hypothetical protein
MKCFVISSLFLDIDVMTLPRINQMPLKPFSILQAAALFL